MVVVVVVSGFGGSGVGAEVDECVVERVGWFDSVVASGSGTAASDDVFVDGAVVALSTGAA